MSSLLRHYSTWYESVHSIPPPSSILTCGALWCLSRQESPDKLQEVVNLLRSSSNSQVRRVGESFIYWVPNGLVVFLYSVLSQREMWKKRGRSEKRQNIDELSFVSVSNHPCVYNICNVYNIICVFKFIYTYIIDGFQITHSSLWFTTVKMSFQKLPTTCRKAPMLLSLGKL